MHRWYISHGKRRISVAALFDQRATGCKKSALCFVPKIFFQVTPLTFWERNLPHGFQTSAENFTQTPHQRINFSWVAKPQGAMRLCQFRLLRVYQVLQLRSAPKEQTSGQIAIIFHQPAGPKSPRFPWNFSKISRNLSYLEVTWGCYNLTRTIDRRNENN